MLEVAITLSWEAANPAGVRDRLELRKDSKRKATRTSSSAWMTMDGSASMMGLTLEMRDVAVIRPESIAADALTCPGRGTSADSCGC